MKGAMNESDGVDGVSVSDEGDNAVSGKLFGHVNVVDVDIGVICRGDSLLDGLIEQSPRLVNWVDDFCFTELAGRRLKQDGIASHDNSRFGRRTCDFGIEIFEILSAGADVSP
jgi:hypothetical protein